MCGARLQTFVASAVWLQSGQRSVKTKSSTLSVKGLVRLFVLHPNKEGRLVFYGKINLLPHPCNRNIISLFVRSVFSTEMMTKLELTTC